MSVVIVALPREDEEVNSVSSEKVAHLTLAYLGDPSPEDAAKIVLFVQHAASQLSPFGLSVDYRGELGPEQADVLFFDKSGWNFPRIDSFRNHLLLDDTIRKAYESTEQFQEFPEWTPHLTLGYPTDPAKQTEGESRHRMNFIDFDRIAVWVGDFSGPEFRLKYDMDMSPSAMWSDISVGEAAVGELFHYGVKGMRWGVRKGDYEGATRKTNREASKDAQEHARAKMFYGEGAGTRRKLIKASVEAKRKKDPTYGAAFDHHLAKQDLGKHGEKARSERRRKDARKVTGKTARGVHRQLTGGFGQVSLASAVIAGGIVMGQREMRRMDGGVAQHGEEAVNELFHYGVKGMRWGVTTTDRAANATLTREKKALLNSNKPVTVSQRRPGKYVTTKGGKRQVASEDAVKAAAARQKVKKSTTDSLSNAELKAANERMRLEQEFHKLNSKTKRKGENFVLKLFSSPEVRQIAVDKAKRIAAANA